MHMILFSYALVHQRQEIVLPFFLGSESGDVGFIKDASKYYIITFVMHNQNDRHK